MEIYTFHIFVKFTYFTSMNLFSHLKNKFNTFFFVKPLQLMCVVRTGYIISGALCKMEMWGPLFRNYQRCKHSDSLNQGQSPSECGALCSQTGHMPVDRALYVVDWIRTWLLTYSPYKMFCQLLLLTLGKPVAGINWWDLRGWHFHHSSSPEWGN